SGTAILNAAAQARGIMIDLAATLLNLPANQLEAKSGAVLANDGRSVSYKDLVTGQNFHRPAQPTSPLKDPRAFTVIGRSMPRVDIPGKMTGAPMYVEEVGPHRMWPARATAPPTRGG